jgi:thiamine phosphate synthase YjbQ (UPF0047 family)
MKSLTEYLEFRTVKRRELINITPQVESLVKKSGVKEGFCLVNAMHITADQTPLEIWFTGENLIAYFA